MTVLQCTKFKNKPDLNKNNRWTDTAWFKIITSRLKVWCMNYLLRDRVYLTHSMPIYHPGMSVIPVFNADIPGGGILYQLSVSNRKIGESDQVRVKPWPVAVWLLDQRTYGTLPPLSWSWLTFRDLNNDNIWNGFIISIIFIQAVFICRENVGKLRINLLSFS